MILTLDTNILVRLAVQDDARQYAQADALLARATRFVLPLAALCEFVWVLNRGYRIARPRIASTLRNLVDDPRVICDRAAVEAGLAMLDTNGDFADGVIGFEGQRHDGIFCSFDRKAAARLRTRGYAVADPSEISAG